jgi:hypothetical protein
VTTEIARVTDLDGDAYTMHAPDLDRYPTAVVAHGPWPFDLAGATQLRDELTGIIEAAEERESRKLKRGDKVRGTVSGRLFTVITDEDERRMIEVVCYSDHRRSTGGTGDISKNQPAELYERLEAGQ